MGIFDALHAVVKVEENYTVQPWSLVMLHHLCSYIGLSAEKKVLVNHLPVHALSRCSIHL
jgi:hypothetical protein